MRLQGNRGNRVARLLVGLDVAAQPGVEAAVAGPLRRQLGAGVVERLVGRWREICPDARHLGLGEPQLAVADLRPFLLDQPGELLGAGLARSEEHTSELQSLMRISYAVLCLKKKKKN